MNLIGQEHIKNEIRLFARSIVSGNNLNILIQGKSGQGKTTFAKYLAEYTGLDYYLMLGNHKLKEERIIIIDEAHLTKNYETYYVVMDSGETTVIILTTELGDLPEPLVNRCIKLVLNPYTYDELIEIARLNSGGLLDNDTLELVVNRSRETPRVIIITLNRLLLHYKSGYDIKKRESLEKLLDSFGMYEDGFTDLDHRYIEIIKENPASLNTIAKTMGENKRTIETWIEPFLLKRNLIKITQKGRVYNGFEHKI